MTHSLPDLILDETDFMTKIILDYVVNSDTATIFLAHQ